METRRKQLGSTEEDFREDAIRIPQCLSTFTNDLELTDLVLDLMNDKIELILTKKGTITGFFVNLIEIQQQAVEKQLAHFVLASQKFFGF